MISWRRRCADSRVPAPALCSVSWRTSDAASAYELAEPSDLQCGVGGPSSHFFHHPLAHALGGVTCTNRRLNWDLSVFWVPLAVFRCILGKRRVCAYRSRQDCANEKSTCARCEGEIR